MHKSMFALGREAMVDFFTAATRFRNIEIAHAISEEL